eukprot:4408742-Prymnesium_polylepis.1
MLGGDTGSAVPVFSRPPYTQSEQRREQREANTVRTCPTTGLCRTHEYRDFGSAHILSPPGVIWAYSSAPGRGRKYR